MAIPTGTNVPTTIRAGDTTRWVKPYASYPAGTWVVKYVFTLPGEKNQEITATASGTDHAVTLSAAQTAGFKPGVWSWHARATDQSDGKILIDKGSVTVRPDPEAVVEKTFAERALKALEDSIDGDLPTAQTSFNIGGVDIQTMDLGQREVLRNKYKAEVARERQLQHIREGGRRSGGYNVSLG